MAARWVCCYFFISRPRPRRLRSMGTCKWVFRVLRYNKYVFSLHMDIGDEQLRAGKRREISIVMELTVRRVYLSRETRICGGFWVYNLL